MTTKAVQTLRPYQEQALTRIRRRFSQRVNRLLVKWPTGMGKTVLFSCLPDVLKMRHRMLVVVHREELAIQAADKLKSWNPQRSVGIEMAGRESDGEELIVASVQSIGKKGNSRIAKFRPADFDIVVIDEAHHSAADTYRLVIDHFKVFDDRYRLLLGVTATPNRADGKALGELFQEIVHDVSILEGIRHGWLADLRGLRIQTAANLDAVRSVAGDFDLCELSSSVNTPLRNEVVVRGWLNNAADRQTLVFAVDVDHANPLAQTFRSHGVAADAIWGGDPSRAEKLAAHREERLRVLVNCQLLTEGYDDWRIRCIGMARPTESETLYTQVVGRGTRIPHYIDNLLSANAKGLSIEKQDCLILDYVDNTSRHSLITLPSLFGLSEQMDLKGKSIIRVTNEITGLRAKKPTVDITQFRDADSIVSTHEVDLFKLGSLPEIVQVSPFQWHRTERNTYLLILTNGDSVTIAKDLLDKWHVFDKNGDRNYHSTLSSLENGVRRAESAINTFGQRSHQAPTNMQMLAAFSTNCEAATGRLIQSTPSPDGAAQLGLYWAERLRIAGELTLGLRMLEDLRLKIPIEERFQKYPLSWIKSADGQLRDGLRSLHYAIATGHRYYSRSEKPPPDVRIKHLRAVLDLGFEFGYLHKLLAEALYDSGDHGAARLELQHGFEIDPQLMGAKTIMKALGFPLPSSPSKSDSDS